MKKFLIIFTAFVGLAVISYMIAYPTATWRYRMTVAVETPEGIKTGSAVREIFVRIQPSLPEGGNHVSVRGEAVVVDLGERGVLFALLKGQLFDADKILFYVFPIPDTMGGGSTKKGIAYYTRLKYAKKTLEPDFYPLLVHFKDRNDPKSVELVYEQDTYEKIRTTGLRRGTRLKADRFEEIFGEGVKLKEITIEMTDDLINGIIPLTYGSQFDTI